MTTNLRPATGAESPVTPAVSSPPLKIGVDGLSFFYGAKQALTNISIDLGANVVTAFIGPSGCGKSTFLRTLNRMNDIIAGTRVEGTVRIDGQDVYATGTDVVALRRKVGMVFQKSNPFPKTIFENVAYGLRINGLARGRRDLEQRVEASLHAAAIWDEVKDRLQESALDPIATQRIEELIYTLKKDYTIIIVTHNMQQAARVSDYTAFFWLGKLIEAGPTEKIFTSPGEKLTEDYVTGRFG
jgi:phosphate transport system ATP-binding protein